MSVLKDKYMWKMENTISTSSSDYPKDISKAENYGISKDSGQTPIPICVTSEGLYVDPQKSKNNSHSSYISVKTYAVLL